MSGKSRYGCYCNFERYRRPPSPNFLLKPELVGPHLAKWALALSGSIGLDSEPIIILCSYIVVFSMTSALDDMIAC